MGGLWKSARLAVPCEQGASPLRLAYYVSERPEPPDIAEHYRGVLREREGV